MGKKTFSFSSEQRLLKASDFRYVFLEPFKAHSPYFTILVKPNQHGIARLGVIISKKRAKLAVTRNRIRRVIRDSFRLNQHTLIGLDLVVIASVGIHRCKNNQSLHENLEKQWHRVVNLCKNS